jgi:hypothetical protein
VGEESESSRLSKLVSVPVLLAVALLGLAVTILARLFGPETILREVITEVVASFGSTLLLVAIFGLLFRSGLERVLRGAPGGEDFMESAERLKDLLHDLDERDQGSQGVSWEEKLDRIEEDLRSLTESELPSLRDEVAELRKLLAGADHERGN